MKIPHNKNKIEFEKEKHYLGEIIYPIDNGTFKWYKKKIWGVITEIYKKGYWKSIKYFECYDCARVYSELVILRSKLK